MFVRLPPWMIPIVRTAGAVERFAWRETIVCRPRTICAETTMGSTPSHGIAPCVCRPRTMMRSVSLPAIAPAERTDRLPDSSGKTWSPNTASTFGSSSTPWSTISSPPLFSSARPSSAGWNRNTTVPARSFFIPASSSAAPMRMAVCASWPHACDTPTSRPLNCAFTVDL